MANIQLTTAERIQLIKEVGAEIVGEDELPALLESGEQLFTYDGFEPSGQMHIAQGIMRAINTNKMIEAGFIFKMLVADWYGFLNNKMGGDIEKIKDVGRYFIEIWKACGMNLDSVQFVWTSEFVKQDGYWETVLRVGKTTSLNRILRTTEIMGRSESDDLSAAQIFYPAMQCTDIFKLGTKVTQLGMDQRKVNMLAREIGPELGYWKPIVVSSRMLRGLGKPSDSTDPVEKAIAAKMSKSIPDSAIFMTDTPEDVARKIQKAYCLEGDTTDNPILEYCKYLIFESNHLKLDQPILDAGLFVVDREERFGGNVSYASYAELEADFASKKLFPLDLKNAVTKYINRMLQPVREHFEQNQEAKELLAKIQSYQITR